MTILRPLMIGLAVLFAVNSPACAGPRRFHAVSVAVQPILTPGAGWAGAADTAVPAQQGTPGTVAYGAEVAARWVTTPFQTLGAGQTLNVGIIGGHAPTDTEYSGGVSNNLTSVQMAVDNGPWQQAVFKVNPDDGNAEWLGQVRGSDFATDGQHELRAILCPSTGKCIVLQAPHNVGTFNGYIAGNTLTITSLNGGIIKIGQSVMTVGGLSGVRITALGSGTGGNGTYTISGAAQTYASAGSPGRIAIGDQPGFFFSTNKNGSLPSTVKYAGPTGNDSTGTGTSGNPFLSISAARNAIYNTAAQNLDVGGGVICLQGGNFSWGKAGLDTVNEPALTRWLDIRASGTGPCDSVNAGAVTINSNPGTGVGLRTQRVHLKGVAVNGVELTDGQILFGGDYAAIWLDGVTASGPGVTNANSSPTGVSQWQGGAWVNDSSFAHYQGGLWDVWALIKNTTFRDIASVVMRGVLAAVNVTSDTNTPTLGVGDLTSGSNVVTNFVGDTSRLSVGGYLALPNPALGIPNGTTIVSFTSTTITMSANATANATALSIWTGGSGGNVHPDTFFEFGTIGNVVVSNLHANFTTNVGQGFFTDANSNIINAYVVDSDFFTNIGGQVLSMGTPSQGITWLRVFFNGSTDISTATLTDTSMIGVTCGTSAGSQAGLTKRASPTC